MESTKIKVTTLGYYHRDKDMKVTRDLPPRRLNPINRKYFEYHTRRSPKVPNINLNINVPDYGAGELQMESLLEYIKQTDATLNRNPNFVTNKQLLKCIASGAYDEITVEVFRRQDAIFILKKTNDQSYVTSFGKVFENFMTGKSEDEEIQKEDVVRKAVFMARIPMETGGAVRVMYSGEIDAIDNSYQHYELKVLAGGLNDYFWKNKSCVCYWQCILSNVPTMVVGSRTGKLNCDPKTRKPRNLPELSLYEIKAMNVSAMPLRAAQVANNPRNFIYKNEARPRNAEWKVEDGEKRLQDFFKMISQTATQDKDCFIFSKTRRDSEWTIEPKIWTASPFCQLVVSSVPHYHIAWLRPPKGMTLDECFNNPPPAHCNGYLTLRGEPPRFLNIPLSEDRVFWFLLFLSTLPLFNAVH